MATTAIKITGNVTEALAALEALGIKAEETGKKVEGKLGGAAHRTGGVFQRLGQQLGNWGVPFAGSLDKIGGKLSETEGKGKKFGESLAAVGKAAVLGIGAGLGAAGAESVKLGIAFQDTTASLQAHANISADAATKVGDAFLSTAGQTTFSAQQMMDAFAPISGQFQTMYGHALSSGESLQFMRAAMDAAEASGSPLADTTKALASAMMVYHLKVGQAGTASDVMWNTSRKLGVSITDFASSLSRLEPRIAGSGMTIQQTGGYMLELAKEAGNGRQAMRLAGTAIQSMISPSAAAQKALSQMGVTLQDGNGKFIGMRAAIGRLHDAFAKMPASAAAMAAGQQLVAAQTQLAEMKTQTQTKGLKTQEAALTGHIAMLKLQAAQLSKSGAMQAVFGKNANLMASMVAGGIPAFDAATKAVSKSGTAQSAAETQAKTLHGQMEKMKSTVEDLGVRFGEFLIPKLQELISVVGRVVDWLRQHKAVAEVLAAVIGGVLVVAIGAWVVSLFAADGAIGGMAVALAGADGPLAAFTTAMFGADASMAPMLVTIGIVVLAIAAVGLAIYELATHWRRIWHDIQSVVSMAWNDVIRPVFDFIVNVALAPLRMEIRALAAIWSAVWSGIQSALSAAWNDVIRPVFGFIVKNGINFIRDAIKGFQIIWGDVWGGVQTAVQDVWAFIKPIFDMIKRAIDDTIGAVGKVVGAVGNLGSAAVAQLPHGGPVVGHAAGGPVSPHQMYVVGEQGPELFVSDTSGTIIPNHRMGGYLRNAATPSGGPSAGAGGAPNVNVQVSMPASANPREVASEVAWQLRAYGMAG